MPSTIPVQNVYYLLCYAWDKLEEGKVVAVDTLDSIHLVDLFARVLLGGTRHLIRRGFDRGYLAFTEETRRPRGRIEFAQSIQQNLLNQARVVCSVDELDHNVLHNRILKTVIKSLIAVDELAPGLKNGLADTLRWLRNVEEVPLSHQIFRRVQLNRNNRFYDFLLKVCELVYDNLLIDQRSGESRFRDFLQDDHGMARLFEAFVRNFYRIEQQVFSVQALKIKWHVEWAGEEARGYLPEMRTDVCLISSERKIILDCKYYKETLQLRYGKRSIHSGHLYQLQTYLANKERDPGWERCEGLLLYPTVGEKMDLAYQMLGHLVQVKTINLAQDWHGIDRDMREVIAA